MSAFDDLGGAIVTPNPFHQCVVRLAGILSYEDVTGAAQITWRFAQHAAWKQEFVPEGSLSIHQHHVEPMFEMQILKSVIEQKRVNLPFVDCNPAAFYSVLVH